MVRCLSFSFSQGGDVTYRHKTRRTKFDVSVPGPLGELVLSDLLSALHSVKDSRAGDYLLDELLSKFVGKDTDPPEVRRDRAIKKWLDAESLNDRTNARLQYCQLQDTDIGWTSYGKLIHRVRKVVRNILGPLSVEDVFSHVQFTNGASTRVKRSARSALHKLTGTAHITSAAHEHLATLKGLINPSVYDPVSESQEYSVLFTVPKKSDIDRVACKEPELNMLMQRACGDYIRSRLKRKGVNLDDQTINQELARTAWERGLATIDLSSASDTISQVLVLQLLPVEWWSLLDDLRVKFTQIPGHSELHKLEMFSSMGNGFTFELESLIFYAITRVVADMNGFRSEVVSVYGDDIIAPSAIVPRLLRVLSLLGFKPNKKKTHFRGDFRESCGKHYIRGFDVTPFYVRRPITTLPDLIRLLNRVMEWDARGYGFMTTPELLAFHRKYSSHVPRFLWGGVDPADTSCLVTGHAPRERLVPVAKDMGFDSAAGYVHWMMGSTRRDDEAVALREYRVSEVEPQCESTAVCPQKIVGYKAIRCSKGWHTSWSPWVLDDSRAPEPGL